MGEVTRANLTAQGAGGAGLGTSAARWSLVTVWALGVTGRVLQGSAPPPEFTEIVAYATLLPTAFLLSTPGDRILSRARELAVVAGALVTQCLVIASTVRFDGDPTSQQIWPFNFASYLLGLLVARGNLIAGAIGGATFAALGIGWASADGHTPTETIALVSTPLLALVVGTVWHMVLSRVVSSERHHRSAEARAALAAELAAAAAEADRRALAEVLQGVGRPLRAVARGDELDDALRLELTLVESSVRDRIRSPWSRHPTLTAAITRRRRLGADVLLLGERDEPLDDQLVAAAADLVAHAPADSITIHAVPDGGHAAVLSILMRRPDSTIRTQFAPDGEVVRRS